MTDGGRTRPGSGRRRPTRRVGVAEKRPPPEPTGTPTPEDRLVVGLVRGLHGLNGAVRVEVLTDEEGRFEDGGRLFAEGTTRPLTIEWVQPDAPGILVRFREVRTREAAESLRDAYLEVERPADPLPEGEVYWHEVVGVPVTTTTGESLGAVADVFRVGESEVYVIRGGRRGEVLVPAVRAIVTVFEPAAGRIEVDAEALGLDEEPPPRRARGRRSSRLPRGAVPQPAAEPAAAEPVAAPSGRPDGDAASSEPANTTSDGASPASPSDTPASPSDDAPPASPTGGAAPEQG